MQIQEDRRRLHAIPELDRELPKTIAYLRKALEGRNCQVFSPIPGALCAWFDFGRDSAIAFRADADALPIRENTGAAYASTHPGRMHACGHDGHMAILLELARRLDQKKALGHNVLLVFQPAEETTGGAKDICQTGLFRQRNVRSIFGLHLWPGLPQGKLYAKAGAMMARSGEVTVDLFGASAHIAKGEGVDALAAGAELYRRARELEQGFPEGIPRILNFGLFQSGQVRNAVSAHTHMEGSLRAYEDRVFFALRRGLEDIAAQVERQWGCTVSLSVSEGYPAVWNPEDLLEQVKALAPVETLQTPSMTTEDFAWYQRYLPGVFFFLGLGDVPGLHADTFDFDDGILTKGADFFECLAEKLP